MKEIGLDSDWQDVLDFAKNILAHPLGSNADRGAYFAAATNVHIAKRLDERLRNVVTALDLLQSTIASSTNVSNQNAIRRANRLEEKMDALTGALAAATSTLVSTIDAAGRDSSELTAKIHRLNIVLAVIAGIAAVATILQAIAAMLSLFR